MKNPSIASDTEVTDGQVEACVTLVTDAVRKASGVAIRELARNGVLTKESIERVRARGNEVVVEITQTVKKKFAELAENVAGCVKLISGAEVLSLYPTDGKETIAKANDLFTGFLDPDFENWGTDVGGPATKKVGVAVHEMIKDGTFANIFGGLGSDLDKLCLTQAQIIQFVKKYRAWLRTDGYGTFFLFKVGDEFFVAYVRFRSAGFLYVSVYRLSCDSVWNAVRRHRLVVPQLTLGN